MFIAKKLENSVIESIVDGNGFRIVLFTSGCPHHCKGCQNKETWVMQNGFKYTVEEIADYLCSIYKDGFHQGFTFSGGDPLYQSNELLKLILLLKENLKEFKFDIWVYTGYLYEDVKNLEVLNHIDYLIDGMFIEEERVFPIKPFRGSNNQRLLELAQGQIITIS